MNQTEIRTMLDTIGRSSARLTFRRSTEEQATQVPGCWTASRNGKAIKCCGCDKAFNDGDAIELHVNVQESEFAPGKPGCHTKKAWHVACINLRSEPRDQTAESISPGHVLMTGGRVIESSHDDADGE